MTDGTDLEPEIYGRTTILIGSWEGETHPYYPDDRFITSWKDTKIFIHEVDSNEVYLFGRGRSVWRDKDYYFTLSGKIKGRDIEFKKTHYSGEKLKTTTIEYSGTWTSGPSDSPIIEASWDGGWVNIQKTSNLRPLEHAFLSIAPLWKGYFNREDNSRQIELDSIILDFDSGGDCDLALKGVGIQDSSGDRKDEFPLQGTFSRTQAESGSLLYDLSGDMYITLSGSSINPVERIAMAFQGGAKRFAQHADSPFSMIMDPHGNWSYHNFQLEHISPLPPSPKVAGITNPNLPERTPNFSNLQSSRRRRYIPPNLVIDFCKKIIKKRKEKDLQEKRNAKKNKRR